MTFHFPPRQMRADAAAHYTGLSKSAFLERVAAGTYPPGVRDGGARLWLRDDLDAMIDRNFKVGSSGPANDQTEPDPFLARFSNAG